MSYCTIEDLRAEGITEEQFTDEQLEKLISNACEYIDGITGQWFEPREKIFRLDGRGGQNLVLPVFATEIEYVKVDGEILDDDYVLYNRMEDRVYPKIFRNKRWKIGKLNIEVKGTFGYVDEDLTTPADIKRIAMKLALYQFPALSDKEALEDQNMQGLLISETTDGHSYELSEEAVASLKAGAITGDSEIDDVLKKYMRSRFDMRII